jgi:predicted lipoprotein with Yx(FWY)xxD motif
LIPEDQEIMVRSPLALGAVASAVAVLAAGCGSSGTKNTTSAASSSPYSETQSTSASASTTSSTSTPSSATGSASTPASTPALITSKHAKLGTILAAGPKKLTVYLFEADKGSASACSGTCAQVWPPVTTAGAPAAGAGALAADLGTITRSDGTMQVTYKGHPLYYYAKDKDNGDAYGQGIKSFGSDWYVLKPSGVKLDKS